MATPQHPNHFAIGQQILFRKPSHEQWQEGIVRAVSIDDRKHSPAKRDGRYTAIHPNRCDGILYTITDANYESLPRAAREEARHIGCQCDMRIVDADPTGRWVGQQITSPFELALALTDASARGERVDLDTSQPDSMRLVATPGHHLASARYRDLVAWASGISPEQWSNTPEETAPE